MTDRTIHKVLTALEAGRITEREADAYLRAACNTTLVQARVQADPKNENIVATIIALVFLCTLGVLLLDGGITGFVVFNEGNITGNYTIPEQITGLHITGTLYGDGSGSVYLDTEQGSFLVGTITSDDGSPQTEKASYSEGEEIVIRNSPENATYYFDDGENTLPIEMPLNATINGTLLIVTLENTYRLPIIIGDAVRQTQFNELCEETCALAGTNGTLRIEGDIVITEINGDVIRANTAPMLAVAFAPLNIDSQTEIDLSDHFIDADGDDLFYSTSTSSILNITIDGETLEITPLSEGTETLIIYASDLQELVQGEVVIVVRNETEEPQLPTNITVPVNTTSDIDLNISYPALNCSHPDPNQRPLDCIQANETIYFRSEDITLLSRSADPVAKITPIGNLMLRGGYIENSLASPANDDWVRGYETPAGEFMPTVWISSATGDLHLRGTLTEVNGNIVFEERYTAMTNERGIILALIDPNTGDMVLRGNIIPYRRALG